jgi:hypothetical protein
MANASAPKHTLLRIVFFIVDLFVSPRQPFCPTRCFVERMSKTDHFVSSIAVSAIDAHAVRNKDPWRDPIGSPFFALIYAIVAPPHRGRGRHLRALYSITSGAALANRN